MVTIASISVWARALRLPFLTATAVPVISGASIAFFEVSRFDWGLFLLSLIGAVFLHLGTNLANDYFDHKSGNDESNSSPTPFSGGSRVIQEGLIPPKTILFASLFCFAFGIFIGIVLYLMTNLFQILYLGAIGVLIGYFYTATPFKLGYRGFGEILTAIGFGPLMVGGSYLVQAGSFSTLAWLASIPIAILVGLILLINEFPDHDADNKVHKKTLVVLLGTKKAMRIFHLFLAIAFAFTIAMGVIGIFPLYSLLCLLTFPLAIKAYNVSKSHHENVKELLLANQSTIMLHLGFGLLMSLGFVLAGFFG